MAYIGTWGTYYHIPKCGGTSIKYYLKSRYRDGGDYTGGGLQHRPPGPDDDLTNAFTFVRHPADWLLSYFAYIEANNWHWVECPKDIEEMFRFAEGMFWPTWIRAICSQAPGIVGRVYDLYCVPGVKVYHLEDANEIYGEEIGIKNVTEIKPVMTQAEWDLICEAEKDTLERYGYSNQR